MVPTFFIAEDDYHKLRLYVCRAVFPMIYSYCFNIASKRPEGKATFYQKIKLLQSLPPSELEIPAEVHNTFPNPYLPW